MGYDMYWHTKPADIVRKEAVRDVLFNAYVFVRDALSQNSRMPRPSFPESFGWQKLLSVEEQKQLLKDTQTDDPILRMALNYACAGLIAGNGGAVDWMHHPKSISAVEQATIQAELERQHDEHEGYFRLNIWGMQRYRRLMYERGMIVDATERKEPWPEYPGDEHFSEDDDDTPITDVGREYKRAMDEHRAWSPPGIHVPPSWKFGTNDGWHVTVAECYAMLTAAEKHPPAYEPGSPETQSYWDFGEQVPALSEDDRQNAAAYWKQWLAFIAGAAERGNGFKVR